MLRTSATSNNPQRNSRASGNSLCLFTASSLLAEDKSLTSVRRTRQNLPLISAWRQLTRLVSPVGRKIVYALLSSEFKAPLSHVTCYLASPYLVDFKVGPLANDRNGVHLLLRGLQVTQSQVIRIIAAAKEPYKTLFAVAWYTGTRAGELLALTIDRLNFERKTIRIDKTCDDNNRQIRDTTKTDESTATLPMPSALEAMLRNYLQHHWKPNVAGFLFSNPSSTLPRRRDNVVKNGLKPVLRKLGIPAQHTGCTHSGTA